MTYGRRICIAVSFVLCQCWDVNVAFIYIRNPFKFSVKIHLGDEAERGRGIFPKTENTAPLYSKSQTTATITFHCHRFLNSNIIHQLSFGSYFRFLHVFKYRHMQWKYFESLFLNVFPYTLKVKLIFSNQQTAILGSQLRFHTTRKRSYLFQYLHNDSVKTSWSVDIQKAMPLYSFKQKEN